MSFHTHPEMEEILRAYFHDLDSALVNLPTSRREQLVTEIRQHVQDSVDQQLPSSESELRALLDRVGAPSAIAAAALEEEDELTSESPKSDKLLVAIVVLFLVGGLLVGLVFAFVVPTSSRRNTANGTHNSQPKLLSPSTTPSSSTTTSQPNTTTPPTSAPSTTTTPTTAPPATTPPSPATPDGVYVSAVNGDVPHYFLSLTNGEGGSVTGFVGFAYQDGQTSTVFTFTGSAQGGVANLSPGTIPQVGTAAQNPATVPSAISATMGNSSRGYVVSLGSCASYLDFIQSVAQCDFVYSPTGAIFP
ncbi:MAG TPA: hypothetical protein VHZ02_01770 [Acidimicrobiales bacterium]|nr:hypothetical protein [Acidimicrobiales bacterium]